MSDAVAYSPEETEKRINNALGGLMKPMGQDRTDNGCHWIVFALDNTEYAINAEYVLKVAGMREIVPCANAPAYFPGVIWDRDGIIRLVDLRVLLGLEDYLSAIKREHNGPPMIIIIEPDGKRRGVIVDRIVALEYAGALAEAPASAGSAQSGHVKGSIKYDPQKDPALIINPESFSDLEYEDQNAKIDWKGRIDIDYLLRTEIHKSGNPV